MKLKLLITALAVVLAALVAFAAAPTAKAAPIPITGTCTIEQTAGDLAGTFTGTFTPTRFVFQQGQAFVRGTLSGVCTAVDGTGATVTETVNEVINVAIGSAQAQNACTILDLTLGPIHLDLLGLVVDVSQINVDVTAVPGAGNLLGNLLCSVAGLLDQGSGGLLQGVVQLLNRLLGGGLLTF